MKLYVNEKLFSIHNKYYVKNDNNENVYEISSKIISIGTKTTIKDMKGNVLSYIEQRILHITPHYDIYIHNELTCEIAKKFQLFRNDYVLSNGYSVAGNFLNLNFSVYDENEQSIAKISRKFISIGDKYTIEINNKKNLILALSIIVAIANDVDRNQYDYDNID